MYDYIAPARAARTSFWNHEGCTDEARLAEDTMIDLTEFTLNTGADTDLDALDIARAAYRELPTVSDWNTDYNGNVTLTHDNGERLTIDLVTTDGEITDWITTREDEEGDIYDQDGGPARTTDDLAALLNEINSWAA